MPTRFLRATLLAILTGAVVAAADDKPDPPPTIAAVMQKAHGKGGVLARAKEAVLDGKWVEVRKASRELTAAADDLARAKPPRGTPESWDRLTRKYAANARDLADAASDKQADATRAAIGAVAALCGECHAAHRLAK